MTFLTQVAQSIGQGLFESSTVPLHTLGERVATNDGRAYRYVLAGGTALVPGKLQQAPAEVTNHQNLTPAAAAIGDTTVTATLGATAATADQYAGGYVMVTVTPGQGYQYRIKSHAAVLSGGVITLVLEDPILVAWTTSTRIDLCASPYSGVIVNPATASSAPIGVAVFAVPAASYGWIQVAGPACVLMDGTGVVGTNMAASNGTAGAVEPHTGVQAIVGQAITGVATTEYGSVNLTIS